MLFILILRVYFAHIYACCVCTVSVEAQIGHQLPGTGLCAAVSCRVGAGNLGPLEEQPVLGNYILTNIESIDKPLALALLIAQFHLFSKHAWWHIPSCGCWESNQVLWEISYTLNP